MFRHYIIVLILTFFPVLFPNNTVGQIIIFVIYVIGVIAFIIQGKKGKAETKPIINFGLIEKCGHLLLELVNSGDEDLKDINIKISWEQEDGLHERDINQFYLITKTPLCHLVMEPIY